MTADKKKTWAEVKPVVYEKVSKAIAKCAAYEPNNAQTWDKANAVVKDIIEDECSELLSRWRIVCNETVNTHDVVEANELHLLFSWKAKPEDEWTTVKFVLSSRGVEML